MPVKVRPVDQYNWRAVTTLEVTEEQSAFVAAPTYYLCLCNYGELWNPLAIEVDDTIAGFMMWAVDPADGSCWLGGILIDWRRQKQGYGRQAVVAAIEHLRATVGVDSFALSYRPENAVARHLYTSLGFFETGEVEDEEVVARLPGVQA